MPGLPVQLQPVAVNLTMYQGTSMFFALPAISTLAGALVDFTSWTALAAKLVTLVPSPNASDVSFGAVTGNNAGVLTLQQISSDFTGLTPGASRLVITGTDPSGAANVLLAAGTATLNGT